MEFKKLLKVPSSKRTIAITVVVPEPARPIPSSDLSVPKPSKWGRAWTVVKTVGPAVVSIAAVIISVLAFIEQKNADQIQQEAGERQEASLVSFFQGNGNAENESTLTINNLGTNVVYNPDLSVNLSGYDDISNTDFKSFDFILELSDIPACSSATVDLSQIAEKLAQASGNHNVIEYTRSTLNMPYRYFVVQWMEFTDSSGFDWQYLNGGGLQQIQPPEVWNVYKYSELLAYKAPVFKPASGCA